MDRVQFKAEAMAVYLLYSFYTGSATHRTSYAVNTECSFLLWARRPEREADHTPSSGAVVNNNGALSPLPLSLHGAVAFCPFRMEERCLLMFVKRRNEGNRRIDTLHNVGALAATRGW